MKKILLILAAGCTMALVSCEEWLDKYPLAQMSPETFFSNENELQAFSNKFYTVFPSDGLYNEYWDNIIHNDLPQEMRGGRTIALSAKEFALLEYMIRNRGVVLSRERIENHLWNYDYSGGSNVVDVYMSYLRRKIDADYSTKLIHTVWGVGWVLREET